MTYRFPDTPPVSLTHLHFHLTFGCIIRNALQHGINRNIYGKDLGEVIHSKNLLMRNRSLFRVVSFGL